MVFSIKKIRVLFNYILYSKIGKWEKIYIMFIIKKYLVVTYNIPEMTPCLNFTQNFRSLHFNMRFYLISQHLFNY